MVNILIFSFCILIGFLSSINENSWDYFNYQRIYQSLSDFQSLFRFEPLYSLFMLISSKIYNYNFFRFLETFLANYFFLKGSLRYINFQSKLKNIYSYKKIIILILLSLSSLSTFFGARQGLAIGLGVYLLPFDEKENKLFNKLFKFFIVSLIHIPTGLIYLVILFVKGSNIKKYNLLNKNLSKNILILGIFISFVFIQTIANYLTSNFDFLYIYFPSLYAISGSIYGESEISENYLLPNILKYLESLLPSLILIMFSIKNSISKSLPNFILIFQTICFYFIINNIGIYVFGRSSTILKILTLPIIFTDLIINSKIKPNYSIILLLLFIGLFKLSQFIIRFYFV